MPRFPTTIPDPRDPLFDYGPDTIPHKFAAFREPQWNAIMQAVEAIESGTDAVFVEAPTGTGKTLIGEAVRRLLKLRAYYTCTTIALQEQFATDFPYARVLKGRSNYLTESGPLDRMGNPVRSGKWSAITCADCTAATADEDDCQWCMSKESCPFVAAKNAAMLAPLTVLNSAYLLADRHLGDRGLVIADEADMLEHALMSHIEIDISPTRMRQMGLRPPAKKTVPSSWLDWAEDAIEVVKAYYETIPKGPSDVKERIATAALLAKLRMLAMDLPNGGWVYDGYTRETNWVIFRPVFVSRFAQKYLWDIGDKWLLMSATILSPQLMAEDLGMDKAGMSWAYISVPSNFPIENRPVFVVPAADMAFKNRATAWPKMAEAVEGVVRRHPGERILVHTVSYDLAAYLADSLALAPDLHGRNVVTYTRSMDKDQALADYSRTPGSVLLAPSMDRGVDLPGDLCRVQVIAKVPYPNLQDKQVHARMHTPGGQAWYRMQAIRKIVQSTGRGIRSVDDRATTYILDEQFRTNVWQSDYLFPEWWKESLRWDLKYRELTREVS